MQAMDQATRRLAGAAIAAWLAVVAAAGGAVADEPITPLPETVAEDPARVRLGERLFQDVRLSKGDRIACAGCHDLARGGDDGRALPIGYDGRPLDYNTPTVFNVALNFRLNWRGNYRTLEEQIEALLRDPRLMAIGDEELVAKLRADSFYPRAFAAAFPAGLGAPQVVAALAAYQRSLVTPNARFDRYLKGDRAALSSAEERGYELFKGYGCAACHQGAAVGGNLFQRYGIFADPFAGRGPPRWADFGRLTLTDAAADRHVFRVPGLRNVAVTTPYFHDGSARTLETAIERMADSQLGRRLTVAETGQIAAFLRTLTGEYQGRPLGDGGAAPR